MYENDFCFFFIVSLFIVLQLHYKTYNNIKPIIVVGSSTCLIEIQRYIIKDSVKYDFRDQESVLSINKLTGRTIIKPPESRYTTIKTKIMFIMLYMIKINCFPQLNHSSTIYTGMKIDYHFT